MLLLGLGNPGNEYANTRHNAGFLAIDAFADHFDLLWKSSTAHKAELIETNIEGQKVLLAKPQTFMNRSGISARSLSETFSVSKNEIIAIYDDVDLPFGTIRLRKGGSAGGHNGVKSLIESLGSDDFWRIRIGIGEKPETISLEDFVLSSFSKTERIALEAINKEVVEIITRAIQTKTLEEKTINVC